MSEICTVVFFFFLFLSNDCINVWRFLLAEWIKPARCGERETGESDAQLQPLTPAPSVTEGDVPAEPVGFCHISRRAREHQDKIPHKDTKCWYRDFCRTRSFSLEVRN